MNLSGIIVGAAVFLSIGICHPAVIKMEYYWGKQSWWVWLVVGLGCVAASLLVQNQNPKRHAYYEQKRAQMGIKL